MLNGVYIYLIAATDESGYIGLRGRLPWPRIDSDMQRFYELTRGSPIIMGRKTHESIGRVLGDRLNIVISRTITQKNGIQPASSIEEAVQIAKDLGYSVVWVIGGAEIYRMFLPFADRLYITEIHEAYSGDTTFPEFNHIEWYLIERKIVRHAREPELEFLIYQRIR